MSTELIQYERGTTTKTGVYACRVPAEFQGFLKDVFLLWMDDYWSYLCSDQRYRGEILGFVGPLAREL